MPSQLGLAERMAAELVALRDGVVDGAHLLYSRLPIHSLGEGALFYVTCAHLARPCIADADELVA